MRIIYILSAGHSGSTVLGSLLGNCTDTRHIGEFTNFTKVHAGTLETCSCGKLPAECEFWAGVIEEFESYLRGMGLTLDDYEVV